MVMVQAVKVFSFVLNMTFTYFSVFSPSLLTDSKVVRTDMWKSITVDFGSVTDDLNHYRSLLSLRGELKRERGGIMKS